MFLLHNIEMKSNSVARLLATTLLNTQPATLNSNGYAYDLARHRTWQTNSERQECCSRRRLTPQCCGGVSVMTTGKGQSITWILEECRGFFSSVFRAPKTPKFFPLW